MNMKTNRRAEVARALLAAIERANKLNSHGRLAARAERAYYAGRYQRALALCALVPVL